LALGEDEIRMIALNDILNSRVTIIQETGALHLLGPIDVWMEL
jgi:hypothetical protein